MDGESYVLGGREFIVPRIRVLTYERVMRALEAVQKASPESDPYGIERVSTIAGAMHEILRPNYPNLAVDEVKALLEVATLDEALSGLLAAAGKKRSAKGEAESP